MKKIFTFIVAAILLATVGASAQNKLWTAKQNWTVKQTKSQQATQAVSGFSVLGVETPYTALNYSTLIPTNGTPVQGSFTTQNNMVIDMWGDTFTGIGYSFAVEAGKMYRITCRYEATQDIYFYTGFHILTGSTLEGNDNDVIGGDGGYMYGSVLTVPCDFFASENATLRLLLADYELNNLSYTIKIEEIRIPSYTEINYPNLNLGATATSSLSNTDNQVFIDFEDETIIARGYTFAAEAGKTYSISLRYFTPDYTYIEGGFSLLTGGTLQGNMNDIIDDGAYNYTYDGKELLITYNYTAATTGNIRLIFAAHCYYDLVYSLEVKEASSSVITLPELLNNTTRTITYSANMQFNSTGYTTDLVAGDETYYFRYDDSYFYAVAYKITLPAGSNIQIHSAKENDSYLLIYKADGMGGYTFITSDDDGYDYYSYDSYLNLMTPSAGDYYIVVTDYSSYTAGNYYLSVWTQNEPDNTITSIFANSSNINVNINATDEEIRAALMALTLGGTTGGGTVKLENNPFAWYIEGNTATYMPSNAPLRYVFFDSVEPIVITINRTISGLNNASADTTVIYAYDRNIVVRNANAGSKLVVVDLNGKIVASTIVKSDEIIIPVAQSGLYIVRTSTQTTKVVCK